MYLITEIYISGNIYLWMTINRIIAINLKDMDVTWLEYQSCSCPVTYIIEFHQKSKFPDNFLFTPTNSQGSLCTTQKHLSVKL